MPIIEDSNEDKTRQRRTLEEAAWKRANFSGKQSHYLI